MLRDIFKKNVYVKIRANQIEARHIESGRQRIAISQKPFTSERLLIGDFNAAAACLKQLLQDIKLGPPHYFPGPIAVMHPLEKIDGGLSPVESRLLRELALTVGARECAVWVGHLLSDSEVVEKAKTHLWKEPE